MILYIISCIREDHELKLDESFPSVLKSYLEIITYAGMIITRQDLLKNSCIV
mgnify:FL=1